MINEFKNCILCNQQKHFTDFHKNLNSDGRFNVCKKCHYIRNQTRRKDPANRERYLAYSKSNVMFRRYGITIDQYNELVKKQKNKCLICKNVPDAQASHKQRSLHVDHCHKTGKVRGLLCHLCNRAIGLFRERIDLIHIALKYLKKHS